jgi:MFS family permease
MTYGIFQEYYLDHWSFHGSQSTVGVIGTTYNGVMYLGMPLLFALFTRRWVRYRLGAAVVGLLITCASFLVCSFSTNVWHLVLAQGVLAAVGGALLYTPTTLSLSEHFAANNRAIAYGITLSCKNITGTACPFLMQELLDRLGFRRTMWVWTGIVAGLSILAMMIMPMAPANRSNSALQRPRKIPWDFLYHRTFYIYSIAIALQSSGYGVPQTYLNSYAHEVASISVSNSTLLICLFNVPGILSSTFFGFLSDNERRPWSATSSTFFSAAASAMAAFLLWGLAGSSDGSFVLLIFFAVIYGFFAGGYSACWGGVIKQMEAEAAERNEAIDSGMVYGLLNGARGVGYVGGGLAGVQLLKGGGNTIVKFGYGSKYGPLILYTGLATAFGGWSVAFRCKRLWRWLRLPGLST